MSDLANEAVGVNDFEKWLNDRNGWLQTAAKQLIDNKRLPNEGEPPAFVMKRCTIPKPRRDLYLSLPPVCTVFNRARHWSEFIGEGARQRRAMPTAL